MSVSAASCVRIRPISASLGGGAPRAASAAASFAAAALVGVLLPELLGRLLPSVGVLARRLTPPKKIAEK
jgi:hypothetical protein